MNKDYIKEIEAAGIFSRLDLKFAQFMQELAENKSPELFLACAIASNFTGKGHICADLSLVAGSYLPDDNGSPTKILCPELQPWIKSLNRNNVIGAPGEYAPLILDERSLYLYRYWDYEHYITINIKDRVAAIAEDINFDVLKDGLKRLYPRSTSNNSIDGQKIAAIIAVTKRFCVISGGPGTGKTTTIARILALIIEQNQAMNSDKLRIGLVAPTGKAASRLQESIGNAVKNMQCPDHIKEQIPKEASTIHRLLGSIPHSPYFRYNRDNLLPLDLLIMDEASMTDIALASKLFEAVPVRSRIIMTGDREQLASVENGAVFGDICPDRICRFSKSLRKTLSTVTEDEITLEATHKSETSGINDCIVVLKKNYRFGNDSGIRKLSETVRQGNSDHAIDLLRGKQYPDITWHNLPPANLLMQKLSPIIINGYEPYLKSHTENIFKQFDNFRILCAVRDGAYGVKTVNKLSAQILKHAGLINTDKTELSSRNSASTMEYKRWYKGKPVIITRNHYELKLYNGDVGIFLPYSETDKTLRAVFPDTDGSVRMFLPHQLMEYETAYALTVHKSQGAEFNRVLLVLPERISPVLTRELIYTGITRAREHVEIFAKEDVLRAAVASQTRRASGLKKALWG